MSTTERVHAPHGASGARSDILDRLPPQNLDAEKAVLGSLLLDPMICDDIVSLLRPDDFYADAHQRLYRHIVQMRSEGKQIDATLLVEHLAASGELQAVGDVAYLGEIANAVPVASHAEHYAAIVRGKATQRKLIHACTEIIHEAWDPIHEPRALLNRAEEKIFAINDQQGQDRVHSMHDVMVNAFNYIDARMENHEADLGVMTGLIELDDITSGGMHPAELVILAARPSMGKTALATNIAEHVAVEGRHTTLFVSLEMANLELAQRMLCGRGRIDGQKLRKNFLSNEDYERLQHAAAELGEAPLYIDDTPSRNINEIAAVARRLKRQTGGLGLIVIDYLQLIEPDDPRDPRQEQVSKIARRLKGMARELEVPVLCLAQLNRQAEATKDNIPRLSHLRESGAIEQDADVVMFIHREEYYHTPEDIEQKGIGGKAQIILAKQRNGPTGHIEVAWLRNFMKFENLSTRHDEFSQFED